LIFREVEDRDLIAKARRGHVEAYNVLVSRWEKRVFNYLLAVGGAARGRSRSQPGCVFEGLSESEEAGRPGEVPGWLFRIAHNEAYSLLRKNRPEGE
jgi:RNA polymerase sigma-70 factor (ECF subfamily)